MKRSFHVLTILLSLAALALAPACDDKKAQAEGAAEGGGDKSGGAAKGAPAPDSPDALAKAIVEAYKAGKVDAIKTFLATKADLEEAGEKAGAPMNADHVVKVVEHLSGSAQESFDKALSRAKKKDVDWSKVAVGKVHAQTKDRMGVVEHKLQAELQHGDMVFTLKAKAVKLSRGFVLMENPRVSMRPPKVD